MINPGVVAAIRVVGVRGDPCGAMRWTAVQRIASQGGVSSPSSCVSRGHQDSYKE